MKIEPSGVFSNGTEYENFMYYFCERCKKGLINENGFAEYPENGGCVVWDAMENARFDSSLFPKNDVVLLRRDDGRVRCWHVCKHFDTEDSALMENYKKLFVEE